MHDIAADTSGCQDTSSATSASSANKGARILENYQSLNARMEPRLQAPIMLGGLVASPFQQLLVAQTVAAANSRLEVNDKTL